MKKVRISMTISPDVLGRIDSFVDGRDVRSRSEAIESVMSKYLEANKAAVFLGGGDIGGLKIGDTLKPLIRIRGKCLIEYNIERLVKGGFRKIYITGKSELVGECFKLLGNGSRHGVSIDYIEEQKTLGNAKTLQLAEHCLQSGFLVLPVDNFFDFDLDYLARAHRSGGSVATLAVQAGRDAKTDLGVVEMVGNRIIGYEEKPARPKTFLTATFIGMYEPAIFDHIPKGKAKWVLQTDVFGKLISRKALNGCIVPGFYVNVDGAGDIRTVEDFLRKKK
jgi:NDP-sugar pyrophosphorylase family protein